MLNVAQRVAVVVDLSTLPVGVDSVWIRIDSMPMTVDAGGNSTDGCPGGDCFRRLGENFVAPAGHDDGYTSGRRLSPHIPLAPFTRPANYTIPTAPQFEVYRAWIQTTLPGPSGAVTPPSYNDSGPPPALAVGPAPDVNLLDAVPLMPMSAPDRTKTMSLFLQFASDPATGVNLGYFNGISSTHAMDVAVPLLFDYLAGTAAVPDNVYPTNGLINTIFYDGSARYYMPYASVVDLTIVNLDSGTHPLHVHGHVFWVTSSSDNPSPPAMSGDFNYVRRDVAAVPGSGWVSIRLVMDNPGIWMAHCHIDWWVAHCRRSVGSLFSCVTPPVKLPHLPASADRHMAAGLLVTLVEGGPLGGDQLSMGHINATIPAVYARECVIDGAGHASTNETPHKHRRRVAAGGDA